jgi:hypothetical protein
VVSNISSGAGSVQQHAASFIARTEASTGAELPRFIKQRAHAGASAGGPGTRCRARMIGGADPPAAAWPMRHCCISANLPP